MNAPHETTRIPRSAAIRWRRLVGAFIALAALAYLGHLVSGNVEEFRDSLLSLSPVRIVLAIGMAMAMLLLKALYHVILCGRISGKRDLARDVLPAYCTAQVVRYLPGKIWGIVYQANRLSGKLHAGEVVTANAIQTITTNLLGAGIIVSILAAAYSRSLLPLAGIVLAVALTEAVHRMPWLEHKLLGLAARVRRKEVPIPTSIPPLRWHGTSILVLEWVFYFGIWFMVVGGMLPTEQMIVIGTWYAAASLLAILAIAVPGGLAVREAIFVSLGSLSMLEPAALVGYAAALRVILTIGELGCVPVAHAVRNRMRGTRG